MVIGKRQRLGIAKRKRHDHAAVDQLVAASAKHVRIDVGEPDFAVLAGGARKRQGKIPRATGDVEDQAFGQRREGAQAQPASAAERRLKRPVQWLLKPFTPAELREAVRRAIDDCVTNPGSAA